MRNLSLAILFCLPGLPVFSQIQIAASDLPVAGDNVIFSSSSDKVDETKTGANYTWDFSTLKPTQQDTFKYLNPANISLTFLNFAGVGSSALKQPGGNGGLTNYSFYKTSLTRYAQVGMGITGIPIPLLTSAAIPYKTPDIIYNLPLKAGMVDSCTYEGSFNFMNLVNISVHGKRVNMVDGYGTLKTPYKTLSVIRVKSVVVEIDSVLGAAVPNSRIEYKWLAKGEKIPVLEIDVPIGGAAPKTVTYKDIYRNIVNPNLPVAGFFASQTSVSTSTVVNFTNTTTSNTPATYRWTFTPNTVTFVNGTSATSANPSVTFTAAGTYSVSLLAINGGGTNTASKPNYITVAGNAGISSNGESIPEVRLYPNPAGNSLTIEPGQMDKEHLHLQLLDLSGKQVPVNFDYTHGDAIQLDLSGLAHGRYFIRLQDVKEVRTLSFDRL